MTIETNDNPRKDLLSDDLLGSLGTNSELKTWKLDANDPPLFIAPVSSALLEPGALPLWLRSNRAAVDALLLRHGGIVFRGFSVSTTEEFNAVVEEFEPFSGNYQGGGAPRTKIAGRVYEATQLAGHIKIMLHQEMTYVAQAPRRIIFFCCKPAARGGETIVADMRRITRELPCNLREQLDRLGAQYIRNFGPPSADGQEYAGEHPDQRSWKFAFYTDDIAEVEAACREKDIEPVWLKNGGLMVRSSLPAFTEHPTTGERIYRNVLHNNGGRDMMTAALAGKKRRQVEEMLSSQEFKTGCYLGDGSEIDERDMMSLNDLFDAAERSWKWEAGDIMLLDNLLTAHGRNPFEGTRDIQVALLD